VGDIQYFLADQKYVTVVHDNGRHLIEDSLKSLEEEFAGAFVRIHRSALVAVARIESLKKTADGQSEVLLRNTLQVDTDELIVSRRHLTNVKRRLKKG
jgi:two-component system response regulator AlgR